VCSGSSLSPHKKGTFDTCGLSKDHIKITDSDYGKIWNLDRCGSCTHIFANPCPSKEFIQSLYGGTEDPLYQEEARGRSKNFKRILKVLDRIHPEKGILFDVGAATGILLDVARKQGWRVEGTEPSAWAVRTAREKYGLNITEGPFEEARLPENRYSVVTMVDFIEHIPHPFEAVSIAEKILLPGGTLCLVTPDIHSLAAKIMGLKWWHCRPGHLGYFSKKSLATLVQRAGLRLIKMRKYSWTFSLHYLLSRRSGLKLLLKNHILASLFKKIPIKLALQDSFEIYARKDSQK
jgi:2-polyprenyl-3-methyl-5-hydroxy-6-metoxy-1,4-benzoquinol methylase